MSAILRLERSVTRGAFAVNILKRLQTTVMWIGCRLRDPNLPAY
jgi:hypothetical protein